MQPNLEGAHAEPQELDRQAVERMKAGDQAAFRELFDRYHTSVFRLCARYGSFDRDQLTDLVQQVMVFAYQRIDQLRNPEQFSHWLFTLARNHVISVLRKRKTEQAAYDSYAEECEVPDCEDPYFREQILTVLEQIVPSEGDETTRAIVRLYYGGERVTTREISERLGVPKGTVTVKLQRFRHRVHARLVARLLEHEVLESQSLPRWVGGRGER